MNNIIFHVLFLLFFCLGSCQIIAEDKKGDDLVIKQIDELNKKKQLDKSDEICWQAWRANKTKMLMFCKSIANAGGAKSLFVWGMHLNGQEQYIQSMEYLKKSIVAGFHEAYGVVGDFYYYGGGGLRVDQCKAMEVYQQGKENGNPTAAKGYVRGILTGICQTEIKLSEAWDIINRNKLKIDGQLQSALATGYFTKGKRIKGAAWSLLAKESGTMDSDDLDSYLENNFTDAEMKAVLKEKKRILKAYKDIIIIETSTFWYQFD